jgi:hypothetical protein
LCYHGIPEESNFEQGIQQAGPGNGRQNRLPAEGQPPDFSEAASALGITQEELISALGGRPPDLEKASKILGIPVEDLRKFIPLPPRK